MLGEEEALFGAALEEVEPGLGVASLLVVDVLEAVFAESKGLLARSSALFPS